MSLHSKANQLSYKSLFLIIVFLLIPIILLLRVNQKATPAVAGWFNDAWSFRKAVSITNSVGTTLTDFQVSISIGTSALINSGKMKTDCSDLRVTDTNGKLLPHWIEENNPGCNAATDTKIWVKVPNIPSSGGTVYVYYGNPSATNIGDGNKVFEFFDDFNDGIYTSNWSVLSGTWTESGGTITQSDNSHKALQSKTATLTDNLIVESRAKTTSDNRFCVGAKGASVNSDGLQNVIYVVAHGNENSLTSNIWDGVTAYNSQSSITVDDNTFYVLKEKISGDIGTAYLFSSSGNQLSTTSSTHAVTTLGNKVQLQTFYSAVFDWVFVHKSASTDPSSSLSATEETSKAPVAYWSFDEGVGTTVFDASSNRNHGTFGPGTSAPSWQTEDMCISGKCLKFDGTYSYINVGDPASLDFGTNNFSITTWIKTTAYSADTTIMEKRNGTSGALIRLEIVSGKYTCTAIDGSNFIRLSATSTLPTNQWTHLSCTIDNTNNFVKIYINGSLNNTSSNTFDSLYNTGSWTIGKGNDQQKFNGFIDEVKIYPYARSASEIKNDYNAGKAKAATAKGVDVNLGAPKGAQSGSASSLSDGLVGYWKMDENTGTSTADSSGNSNTATFGSGSSAPAWGMGKYGVGLSFDGVNDYSSVTVSQLPIASGTKFTLAFWIKWDGTSTKMPIRFGGGSSFDLFFWNGFGINTWNSDIWGISSTGFANTWKYITYVIYNGDLKNSELYVDGVRQTTSQIAGTINNTRTAATSMNIGSGPNNYQWGGLMDEVRIYNRALTPTEVKQLYEWAPGPIVYISMNEGTGGTAYDSSGYGNHAYFGAGSSAPDWVTGKYGRGLAFTSSRSTYAIFNSAIINASGTKNFTAGVWMKKKLPWSGGYCAYCQSGGNMRMDITSGGNISYRIRGGAVTMDCDTVSNALADGNWHYATVTYDGAQTIGYVDGVQKCVTAGVTAIDTPGTSVGLGVRPAVLGFVDVFLDEAKMYNYALTQKQIVSDMNAGHPNVGSPIASALAHYKFDEGYGTVTANWGNAGVGLSGVFGAGNSAPTWTQNGKFGKALSFDGNDDYVNINDNSSLDITTDLTLSAWVKTSDSNNGAIVGKWKASNNSYWLGLVGNSLRMYLSSDGTAVIYRGKSNASVNDNNWHHVVAVYKTDQTIKIYKDGIEISLDETSGTIPTSLFSGTGNVQIGRDENSGNAICLNGLIDDVKIYNYALTSDEVKTDYNQGKALVMGSLSSGTGNTAPSNASSQEYCVPGDTATCLPPVARWDFEEGVGTSAFDTSGSNNSATLGSGATTPTWVNGKIGKGLSFNGTSNFAVRTMSPELGNNATIDLWYKPRGNGYILDQNWGWIDLSQNGSQVSFYCINCGTMTTNSSLNNWHHATGICSYTAQNMSFYLDGLLVNSIGCTQSFFGNNPITLGAMYIGQGGGYFNGLIDQVRIYNYARSPAQIAWDYNRGEPIAHYKMDECQGAVINDWSGNNLHGTLSIGASGSQNIVGTCNLGAGSSSAWGIGATGKINSGLSFDGNDDYVNIPDGSIVDPGTSDFTLSAWIFPNNINVDRYVIAKERSSDANYQYRLVLNNINKLYFMMTSPEGSLYGSDYTLITSSAISNSTWHFVTVTRQGVNFALYVDGVLMKTASTASVLNHNNGYDLRIGARYASSGSGPANVFNGKIDDVQIYNYALTATQIKTLYNGGAANFK